MKEEELNWIQNYFIEYMVKDTYTKFAIWTVDSLSHNTLYSPDTKFMAELLMCETGYERLDSHAHCQVCPS